MLHLSYTIKVFLCGIVSFIFLFGTLFFWIAHGEPIHDINTWWLEKNFYADEITHPSSSVLLEKKKYLGGPSMHGDNRCIYAVGEARIAPLTIDEIKLAYQNTSVSFWGNRLSLKILFTDEFDGPYEMPFINWQDELRTLPQSDNTAYVVYVTEQRRILLSDWRCDD